MKSRFVIAALACFVVACEPSRAPVELNDVGIRSVQQEIQGGTVDTTSTNVIGMLINSSEGVGGCTGSLIAPNLVLTARHCVAPMVASLQTCSSQPFGATYGLANFRLTTLHNGPANITSWPNVNNTTWFGAAAIILPTSPGNTICGGDIALIRLTDNVPGVCPLVPRVDTAVNDGEGYTAVGFGRLGPTSNSSGTRYTVGGMSVLCDGSCDPGGMSATLEWIGGASTAKGTCQGDSGGPSLDSLRRVTGVVSRGPQGSCNETVYGSVFGHAAWIKAQAAAAATVGGYTAAGWVTGGSTTINPCAPNDGGSGGGAGGGGGNVPTGGGGGSMSECPSGQYCAEVATSASACITTSNAIPPSAPSCSMTVGCPTGLTCFGTSATAGVCLQVCANGVPIGGGGGSATGGGGGGMTGSCPSGEQCIDGTGAGNFICVTTSNGIPPSAPSCTGTGACPTGFNCFGLGQGSNEAVCLRDCGGTPVGGGSGGGVPVGGGSPPVGGGAPVGGGSPPVGGGVPVGGGAPVGGGSGGGTAPVGGGTENPDGGAGGGTANVGGGNGGNGGNGGFGGGFIFPPLPEKPKTSGCSCNTVDPSFLALGLLGLLRRRRGTR